MEQTLRRALLRRWVRGSVAIGLLLLLPAIAARLETAFDPGHERREISRVNERRQRANGVPFVTATGETVTAVVYSPTFQSQAAEDGRHRALVWWSRMLAAVTALGLLTGTWQLLRQRSGAPESRATT